jgi:DNA-binding CsgD family transcriptional regulator
MQSQLQLLKKGLESASSSGAIACDAKGRVQFITTTARRLLVDYFGAPSDLYQRLPQELLCWMQCQDAQNKKDDLPAVRVPFAIQKRNKQLTARLLSEAGDNLLLLEEKTLAPKIAVLESLGLSRRESEVLTWVAQGKTNGEVATILGISLPTAKKHLEHIFEKLGVETRTGAAAFVLQALPRNDE